MSHHVAILGAGKIGRMTAHFLASCGDYTVRIGDAVVRVGTLPYALKAID